MRWRLAWLSAALALTTACAPRHPAPDAGPGLLFDAGPGPADAGPDAGADAGWDHSRIHALLGPDGGALALPGGASLLLPPGALASAEDVSITGADPLPAPTLGTVPVGQAFVLEPDSAALARPARVSLPFDPARIPAGAPPGQLRAFATVAGADGGLEMIQGAVDAALGQLTARTGHFSTWQLGLGTLEVTAPAELDPATRGQSYGPVQLQAAGGATTRYSWRGLRLPPGLLLSDSGVLSGTPTSSGGQTVAAQVSDGAGQRLSVYYDLWVAAPDNPAPLLTSLDPARVPQGTTGLTLALHGQGFLPSSAVTWDGATPLAASYLSPFELSAPVPDALLASPGDHLLTVTNPPPGGGTSSALTLTVTGPNPVPALSALDPAELPVGTADAQVLLLGSGFAPSAQLRLNGAQGGGFDISDTQFQATIPAALLGSGGVVQVALFNPAPGGGLSNSLALQIVAPDAGPGDGGP